LYAYIYHIFDAKIPQETEDINTHTDLIRRYAHTSTRGIFTLNMPLLLQKRPACMATKTDAYD